VIASGCHSQAHPDPATVYQKIHAEMLGGNLDLARSDAEKARNDFAAYGPAWDTKLRILEAQILTYQGLSAEVVPLLNCDSAADATSGDAAIQTELLCSLAHVRLAQSQKSADELHQAQQLAAANHSSLQGEALLTQGLLARHFNRLEDANEAFEKSLDVARKNNDAFLEARDLINLGWVAVQMEHFDQAVALLNSAASAARPIQARTVIEAALGNLGAAYFYLGDYEKALSNFQQAEEEAKKIGSTSGEIDWLWDAGAAYYKLGNLEDAKSYYGQALKAAKAIDDHDEVAGIDTQLGSLLYRQGRFDLAKTCADEAIQAASLSGDKSAEAEPRFLQALLATRQGSGQDGMQMLMQVYQDTSEMPSLRWDIENAVANLLNEQHQSQQAERWYQKSIHTFETQRASVADEELKLPFFANGDALYRDYADFLIQSHTSNEALQLLDLGRARTLEEGLGVAHGSAERLNQQPIDARKVAARLDAIILFYALGPEKSYLWAISAQSASLFPLPKQSEIESRVQQYQKAILRSSDPLKENNEAASALYSMILAPASAMIPSGSRVFIVPDGALNGLNFETLIKPGDGGNHYWIEDVTITSTNSVGLLSRSGAKPLPSGENKLLLIGNPILSASEYEALPNAATEIEDVQKHFAPDRRITVTQAAAVPAAYIANKPDQFSYIHFVAHGTASRLSPLDSAVILSAPPDHPENFKLYARDIVRHPLHAQLVTISACYGSGLRAYAGEGLVGLSWAFLRAGSHNVIGALWEANDASTPQLMDRLYTELQAGRAPDEALRTAKLSLIHSPGIYRKPLYWAAFQLYAGS
jgi:CHAT domain-containing protein